MMSYMIPLPHLRVPSYKYLIGISCNGHRNVLWNNCIIDKFVDTINGFVYIRIVGGHSFLCHGTPIFNSIFCSQSNLEFKFKHVAMFVKILFQQISCLYTVSHFSYTSLFEGPHFLTKMLKSNILYDNLFIDI